MPPANFRCRMCGHCCTHYAGPLPATEEDLQIWRQAGRDDILAWVRPVATQEEGQAGYALWFDPRTGQEAPCPWLHRRLEDGAYICLIHDLKAAICRVYPRSEEQARHTGCGGFFIRD